MFVSNISPGRVWGLFLEIKLPLVQTYSQEDFP